MHAREAGLLCSMVRQIRGINRKRRRHNFTATNNTPVHDVYTHLFVNAYTTLEDERTSGRVAAHPACHIMHVSSLTHSNFSCTNPIARAAHRI